MSGPVDDALIDKEHRINFTIWVALVISLFLYTFVGLTVGNTEPDESAADFMLWIFVVFSVICGSAGTFLRKKILAGSYPIRRKRDDTRSRLTRYRKAMIVALALYEAIGLYGLILYLVLGDRTAFFVFMTAAIILQVTVRPERDKLVEFVREGKIAPPAN